MLVDWAEHCNRIDFACGGKQQKASFCNTLQRCVSVGSKKETCTTPCNRVLRPKGGSTTHCNNMLQQKGDFCVTLQSCVAAKMRLLQRIATVCCSKKEASVTHCNAKKRIRLMKHGLLLRGLKKATYTFPKDLHVVDRSARSTSRQAPTVPQRMDRTLQRHCARPCVTNVIVSTQTRGRLPSSQTSLK